MGTHKAHYLNTTTTVPQPLLLFTESIFLKLKKGNKKKNSTEKLKENERKSERE